MRSQLHLLRMGRPTSGGVTISGPPITAVTPPTATLAAAGALGRVIATLGATGGTPPFAWTITSAGGVSANIVGSAAQTTVNPCGTVGPHTMTFLCTDSRGITMPLSTVVTLT